ncbi:hypothetical protein CN122_34075, partial [Sinorhizobium meliloti]
MVGAETNGFLDSRHHKFCRRMSSLDLPEGLAERIIQCNSSYTVRFGVRLRGRMYNFIRARSIVCGVHAPLIFQLRRSEADPRRSNELTEEYLTSS